jgi:gas vesicle protein
MDDRDRTDLWTALAVGAVVGIGAALLLRAGDEPETRKLLSALKPVEDRARRGVKRAGRQLGRTTRALGHRGEDLLEQGADTLGDLRRDASRIIAQAREELEDIAHNSLKQAKRTARRARRRLA